MKLYKNLQTAIKEKEDVKAIKLSIKENIFPLELFDLPHLEEAYLEGACTSFPDHIKGWKNLKVLSIKWDKFSGDLSGVLSLPQLENLKIIETPMKMFLLPLGKINAPLRFLTIKGSSLEKIPEEISMCVGLTELSLPSNRLSDLPFAFKELKLLKRLNLDGNQFKHFPEQIKGMKSLTHLSIDGNQFSDEEKARIQREFHLTVN